MDLNKVQIIGRLTRDPEVRTTPTGKNVCSFSVATGFTWTDQSGQKKEQTEFHNVIAWGKLGDIIGQYMKKGRQIYIEGRLQTRSWEGQDKKKNYRTEIIAENMIMLGSKPGEGSSPASSGIPQQAEQPEPKSELPEIQIDNDDLPF